jgi:RimJ/RimL family protein N-acetyltransferase
MSDSIHNLYKLRCVKEDDHHWLVDLHNDPLVLYNLTHPEKITIDDHMRWWSHLNTNKERRFIFTVNDERVGFTKFYSIDSHNNNCVLGADIHKNHRGKGYARQMWSLMLEYCFNDLNMWRVSLTTAEYNKIGQKVYRKLGFVDEGRLVQSLNREEKYYDQILMYMTKDMYKKYAEK